MRFSRFEFVASDFEMLPFGDVTNGAKVVLQELRIFGQFVHRAVCGLTNH